VRVLFADVEGQGDRDAAYDARLASAILPLTKCVIFNLGVMQRAAHNVDLGEVMCVLVAYPDTAQQLLLSEEIKDTEAQKQRQRERERDAQTTGGYGVGGLYVAKCQDLLPFVFYVA